MYIVLQSNVYICIPSMILHRDGMYFKLREGPEVRSLGNLFCIDDSSLQFYY